LRKTLRKPLSGGDFGLEGHTGALREERGAELGDPVLIGAFRLARLSSREKILFLGFQGFIQFRNQPEQFFWILLFGGQFAKFPYSLVIAMHDVILSELCRTRVI
jgi:hypothetical protein